MKRPHVLHVISHLALGGAERVALSIAHSLRGTYDFSVYAVRGLADGDVGRALEQQLSSSKISLHLGPRVPMRYGGIVTGAMGLARAVRRFAPDLLHLHTEIPEASHAALCTFRPGLRRVPVVRTIHNSVIWHFSPALGRACDRKLETAAIAGVSDGAVEAFQSLRAASGAKPPPLPPVTIYNGVASPRSIRPSGPSGETIRIVYGGRWENEKGTDLLPAIIAQTQLPAGRRAHLTIFGSGRHEPLLRAIASAPPKGWQIEVLSPIPDFAERLSSFDVALLPSRYEGLPLVAIEALLAGIQVVASDAPGLREALPPEHPWLAPVDDAASFAVTLSNVCANQDRWPQLSQSGRDFAATHFAPAGMAAGYDSLYRRVLALNRASPARSP
ncbi:MAG: glycosyltransferase family 4 protein [Opitutus sp.]